MSAPWVATAAILGLPDMGPVRASALLAGRDPDVVLDLIRRGDWSRCAEVRRLRGVDEDTLMCWTASARLVDEEVIEQSHRNLGVVVDTVDSGLPASLRDDPEPPHVMFRLGAPVRDDVACVAVIGTRRCTGYGRAVAAELGVGLAASSVSVLSGLATGIDGAAQRAALDAGGAVVGIVGSGLDVVYPRGHRQLWHRLAREGSLLSEYPLGTRPARWRFPARNRLIAALADVVVVVESGVSGGSMHTVEAAIERDTPVMSVPGPVTSPASHGTNRLLADGCAPVCGVDDVLVAVGFASHRTVTPATTSSNGGSDAVLDALGWEPATVDELSLRSGLGLDVLIARLVELEMAGVASCRGGWWERTQR